MVKDNVPEFTAISSLHKNGKLFITLNKSNITYSDLSENKNQIIRPAWIEMDSFGCYYSCRSVGDCIPLGCLA